MFDTVDDYVHRPMRYRNIDGIWEMGVGFQWLGFAVLEMLQARASENSVWHSRGTLPLGLLVLTAAIFYSVRVLKKRITYPRTGFVKYRDLAAKPWIAGAIAGAIAIAVGLFVRPRLTSSMMAAVASVMFGLLYALGTRLDEWWRWVVLVVMVGGGVAISTLPLDREWQGALHLGFQGLTLFVSGGIALCLYLRRTRPPEQEAE